MYLRVTRGHPDPAQVTHGRCLIEDGLVPARSLPGCRGASAGLDSESGALVVITWWDTREQAQGAGGGLSPGEIGDVAVPLPEIYEVTPRRGSHGGE